MHSLNPRRFVARLGAGVFVNSIGGGLLPRPIWAQSSGGDPDTTAFVAGGKFRF